MPDTLPDTVPEILGLNANHIAVLHENQRTTRYLSTGRGPVVIVLLRWWGAQGVWPALLRELAREHRLIVPHVQGPALDVAVWLPGFLDGIGVTRVLLVAGDDLVLPSAEAAADDPERIRAVVLVPASIADHVALGWPIWRLQIRGMASPLVLHHTAHDFDVVLALRRFLCTTTAPTVARSIPGP